MPRKKQYKLREAFLTTFVKNLIVNSYVPKPLEKEITTIPKEPAQMIIKPIPPQIQFQKIGIPQRPKIIDISQPQPRPLARRFTISPPVSAQPQIYKREQPYLPPPPAFTPAKQPPQNLNLGKLAPLLMDPAVFSVESPGPGKNVLVNRSGQPQTTSIMLTKEEIDKIMNELSDKTRIPIIPGVFKASFQDLLITAVVSEFVGTRFIIQKKMPGMQPR